MPLLEFIEHGGGGLRRLREQSQPLLRAPDLPVPVAFAGALFDEAARTSGIEDLGHRLGLATSLETFGAWGVLLDHSPTVGAFLQAALSSYRQFNTGYHLWTVIHGDDVWLHLRYTRSLRAGRSQAIDLSLQLWLAAFRALLGPTWRPAEIHLERDPPGHAHAFEAMAERRVCFGQPALAFVFPRRLLARRGERLSGASDARAGSVDPATDFAGSARQTVAALVRLGVVDLGAAAEAAGTSERSFQRRLREAGLTFSGLVDAARFDAARALLADPQRKVIDVSTELGYRDSANFTRAFRRWSGVSPQLFRRESASSGLFHS